MQGVAAFPPLLVCAITQLTMLNRSVTVLETKMGGGVFRRLLHPTVRIPVIYLAVAVPWVFLTDVLVRWAAPSDGVEAAVASGKGVGFVVVTTLFLYAGIRQSFQTITRAQHDAEASERRFRALVSSLDDLVFMTDRDQRFTELVGPATTPEDRMRFIGHNAVEIFGQDVGRAYMELGERVQRGETVYLDWFRETAPLSFPVTADVTSMRIALAPLRDSTGSIVGTVGVGRDTSHLHDLEREREQAENHISFLVNYDTLTGLPNRTLLESRLAEAIAIADRDGFAVAVSLLNIDDFKDVNDSLGYEVGDDLLRSLSHRLRGAVGPHETLARLGGDEFVVVSTARQGRSDLAEHARAFLSVFDTPLHAVGQEIYLNASMGIALYPDDAGSPEQLLRAADTAMNDAKAERETGFAFFQTEMASAAHDRLTLANELRRALQQEELSVAYQPVFDARDGRIVAFEALARWRHAVRGDVSPSVFIPVAERAGLVDDVGDFVRRTAYGWLIEAQAAGFSDLQINVNVSPYHFRRGSVTRLVDEARSCGVDPHSVTLEITESALVDAKAPVVQLLDELRSCGFGLAVDDFGTGYSSLIYLARLPVTELKLAQEFVAGYEVEGNRVVIETSLEIARRLGYQTIAEGVEQEGEAQYLRSVGVDCIQGFLYGRPVPADEAFAMLLAQTAE